MFRAIRLPATPILAASAHRFCFAEERKNRFQQLPTSLASQRFEPAVPYPGWDDNWDYLDLRPRDVAKRLSHPWPIADYPDAIHKLYAAHTDKSAAKVDEIISANQDDLPSLYKKAFTQYAWGGAVTRHIILVRHGQYDEQHALSKRLHAETKRWGLPGDTKYAELDQARVLTPLGREQALKVGDRLAAMLEPALRTPGREHQVRIHVSTLTRANETADIIASRLPSHVIRCAPDPNLSEGEPSAHIIPYMGRGGEEALEKRSRDVHVDGARLEAAFRSYFYRDVPCKPPKASDGETGGTEGTTAADEKTQKTIPRHEYDIVVCHMNVIRYFTLRALQLPPEAWLRLGGHNGSVTHLKIRPSGTVSLACFGDSGHLSLEETTCGMTQGHEK
eukprot:TRINITY_DN1960_c4_g1_i1.p1 TRINITY_DN1960_c4_g1~~TRINITY_DN1960_c4_g1_i1.p1  ORF type:complete len:412 (-),score=35.21 TRINITY_DN1960_c4_g1_i1:89-1261(-)